MANIKSAEKRIRRSVKRTQRNRSVRSKLRTTLKEHREQDVKESAKTLPSTFAQIDIAWRKGVIHKNAAARYKARLAKKSRANG